MDVSAENTPNSQWSTRLKNKVRLNPDIAIAYPGTLIHCHTQSYCLCNHAVNDGLTDFDSKYQ